MSTEAFKRRFISGLCDAFKRGMLRELGKVPENWDGVELRTWFAERAQQERCYDIMGKKRSAEFKNDLIINNL